MNPVKKFNNILGEGKALASVASGETDAQYHKLMSVLRYLRANYQNKTRIVLKEAATNYLDVTRLSDNDLILPSVVQRQTGRTSVKRKKSGVEISVGRKIGNIPVNIDSCTLCGGVGHNKAGCTKANEHGKRLTKSTWGLLATLPIVTGFK